MPAEQNFLDQFTGELIIQSAPKSVAEKLAEIKQKYRQEDIQELEKIIEPKPGIKKITPLLNNPEINALECPGSKKYLIIEKSNKKSPAMVMLSDEEIIQVIDYFSEKTKTPVTKPTYKTILNNMILTSIDSEFGGHKFIITKTTASPSRFL